MSNGHAPVLDTSDFEVNDLTCKSDDPPQEPEVLVDVWQGDGQFVRIPVTSVELWINKDGPADINRTAKVKFPVEWGGVDILKFVNGFDPQSQSPYDMCRIWHYDEQNGNYQVTHFGYVGGVGRHGSGEAKFWVYDPADLLKGIQVSQSWGDPTIAQILKWAVRGTDESGDPIGLENRTVFGQIAPIKTVFSGPAEVRNQKQDTSNIGNPNDASPGSGDIIIPVIGFNLTDAVDDILDYILGTEVTNSIIGGQKSFKRNRNNVVDVLNWFAERLGGKWHFEPTASGPVLYFDNTSASGDPDSADGDMTRRYFVDEKASAKSNRKNPEPADEARDLIDKEIFDLINTLENQALYDIKPFNKLVLFGESASPTRYLSAGFLDASSSSALGEAFPKVIITYPPLIERAKGYEYSKTVESDEVFLLKAKQTAKKKFRQELEEETEGQMTIVGEPYILPYDFVINIPVCDGQFPNVDAHPMRFEVNSVKHVRKAGERYKTELGVSLAIYDSKMEVKAKYVPA